MVVTLDEEGVPDAMPAGWCMFTSHDPTMMAVSIGFQRYTHELLENSKEFVLAFPGKSQKEDVLYCGTKSGREVNKFEETGLETAPPSQVEVPLIEDSVACFECKKRGSLDTGDHTIFSGELVAAHVSEENNEKIYNVGNWASEGAASFKTIDEIKRAL